MKITEWISGEIQSCSTEEELLAALEKIVEEVYYDLGDIKFRLENGRVYTAGLTVVLSSPEEDDDYEDEESPVDI